MKKHLFLLFVLCLGIPMSAQVKNYVSLWGDAGFSSMLSSIENVGADATLGAGGGIGVGYELQKNHFLFTLGLGANIANNAFTLTPLTQTIAGAIDDEGDVFDFVYEQKSRKDSYTNIDLQVPVMFGAQFNKFFFLLGVKANLNVWANYHTIANITSYGIYEKFIDPITGMPQHMFYPDIDLKTSGTTSFNFNILGSAEIGLRLGTIYHTTGYDVPKPKHIFRLSLFADYGLLDIHKRGQNEAITLPRQFDATDMKSNITMNDILSTRYAVNPVNSLLVGIKFTVLFQLPDKKACVICKEISSFRYNNRTH